MGKNQRTALAGAAASNWLTARLQLLAAALVTAVALLAATASYHHHQSNLLVNSQSTWPNIDHPPLTEGIDLLDGSADGDGAWGSWAGWFSSWVSSSRGFRVELLGLCLAYCLPVVQLLNGLLTSSAETEQEMVAVERVMEYVEGCSSEEPGLQEKLKRHLQKRNRRQGFGGGFSNGYQGLAAGGGGGGDGQRREGRGRFGGISGGQQGEQQQQWVGYPVRKGITRRGMQQQQQERQGREREREQGRTGLGQGGGQKRVDLYVVEGLSEPLLDGGEAREVQQQEEQQRQEQEQQEDQRGRGEAEIEGKGTAAAVAGNGGEGGSGSISAVCFHDVWMSYVPARLPAVLRGVSFSVKYGETLGVCGRTGENWGIREGAQVEIGEGRGGRRGCRRTG